ncbi:MAG: hypothetical protein ACHP9Z_12290, partial [Streptosporangiales bacterium]
MTTLPRTTLPRALQRVNAIWSPQAAPHHLVYGMTGSGKSTLIKALLGLCERERVLICDPKPAADPVWDDQGDPGHWGRPITRVEPRFGFEGEPGGGPAGLWFRLTGTPDRAMTAHRFGEALDIIAAEG